MIQIFAHVAYIACYCPLVGAVMAVYISGQVLIRPKLRCRLTIILSLIDSFLEISALLLSLLWCFGAKRWPLFLFLVDGISSCTFLIIITVFCGLVCWRSKTIAIYFMRGCREVYSLLGESSFRIYKYILRLGLLLHLFLLFDGSFGFLNFLRGMNSVVVRVKLKLCVERLLKKFLVKIWEHLLGLFLSGELMLIKDAFDFSPFV